MKELTEKQRSILSFIEEFAEKERMPPTISEIASRFHIKTSTAYAHLIALQKKSVLKRTPKARNLELTGNAGDGKKKEKISSGLVPCVGGEWKASSNRQALKTLGDERMVAMRIPAKDISMPEELEMRGDDVALVVPMEGRSGISSAALWRSRTSGKYRLFRRGDADAPAISSVSRDFPWLPVGLVVGFQRNLAKPVGRFQISSHPGRKLR